VLATLVVLLLCAATRLDLVHATSERLVALLG
jgi:hypothetical protein